MAKNSMLDNDFIEDDEAGAEGKEHERWQPPEPQEVNPPKKDETLSVEIGDDTPEEDRGKWVADDERDGEPDLPNEDEVRGYAKGAQKRIGQMTARIHAERRRADELNRMGNEAVNLARRLMSENNQMKAFIENGEKVLMGEHNGRLQSQLAQAKQAYKDAHDAGDTTAMIAAQEQIASAVAKLERAQSYRPMNLPREDERIFNQPPPQAQPQQAEPDPEAVAWQKKNSWFGRDDAMTGYALGYHKQLVEREGVLPDNPEYYSRLNAEMRKRFPDRFRGAASGPERRSVSPVGAVQRTGSAQPRTVRLTESQARLAKRLGLTVEQYAQQVVAEQDQRDGQRNSFTHT